MMESIVEALHLKVIGQPQWHVFPGPGGITGLYLLSESHLSVHTFPEHGYLALNLYSCGPRPDPDWTSLVGQPTGAQKIRVQCIARTH